ncbi:hypothetical protein BD324DRAFT_254115 [Kockovaella imperatae]|uniref:1-phosphatidylinositol-3-phosphate 5-kinase n=1 Tax=Kockovaella imperatae TaxID=4999 RepID=A0A1Y1UQ16_9TREE|nr:hypothetical protein BD324DRAFT_254115 [Kockovaella imperatae]ORX40062.1 hypothetical protein BD324DRAFT_254115 [Kockovaella imperatae]
MVEPGAVHDRSTGPSTLPFASSSISARPASSTVLTTFPAAFDDEPETGVIPTFLSRVKNTFASSSAPVSSSANINKTLDKAKDVVTRTPLIKVDSSGSTTQTEAQAIAEAAKARSTQTRKSSMDDQPVSSNLRPPMHSASSSVSLTPSVASSTRRLAPPGEWRPTTATTAQVSVSPITSVTTTVQASGHKTSSPPIRERRPSISSPQSARASKAHFGLQAAMAQRAASPHHYHPGRPASVLGPTGARLRRSSIATLPDSPSSISLSAMIAANAELSQNFSNVPGFALGGDDTRSVKSLGLVKKSHSVSRLIRRMRGEGLSKHYWMADEHCKECYDCKSIFTTWRRKHHCRICGQIFCSRCASNIIGARRFGQDGAVRVCNLCLKIMEEYKDDDDDDRRSINSISTSFRPASISDRAFLDAAISPEFGPYSKSPFAASQLFSSQPNENLGAIYESVPERFSRPLTPADLEGDSDEEDMWTSRPQTAAPFRRPMDEDAKHSEHQRESSDPSSVVCSRNLSAPQGLTRNDSSGPPSRDEVVRGHGRRVAFPRTETISTDGGDGTDSAPLIGLRTRLSSRASQGGLTALLDPEKGEGLWRARSHSFAHRQEALSGASLRHFMLILEQAIERAKLPNPGEWHRVLSKLLLKVSSNLDPNVRAGDSIDVRAYVKIKKVPGGKISDSDYVDGIVITKNVAHKAMPRRLVNPRIMVVTFPLDYHRIDNQFMSLDPILAQEKDYLRLLTRRIVDVRPHIVLVQRSASRIALDYLLEANIAVARSVKLSAIHQVARCTQADVVASMDRLALEPRLGRCAEFQIQSFEHDLIPGRRKTLMRFEGCHRDLGCTIILRGGDLDTLKRAKIVTDFMALVVCHLKMEITLFNDEHNTLPPSPPLSPEYLDLLSTLDPQVEAYQDRQAEKDEDAQKTRDIALTLQPYLRTVLSASAAIRFPPPAPLARMAALDQKLHALRRSLEEAVAAKILEEEQKKETEEPDQSSAISTMPRDAAKDPYRVLNNPEEVQRQSAIAQVAYEHAEQYKLWRWYTKRHSPSLRPEDFQGMLYLYSSGCEGADKPCVDPIVQAINYYQEDDLTVGQYLEGMAADAIKRCSNKNCDRLQLFHYRLLVHGTRRLQIAMDQFPCPSPGHEESIITWSYCRICADPSPTTILREETWKLSWGTYLEHCFYPPEMSAGFKCPHDAFRDQIRYFAHRNLAIRIHNEQIDLYEPVRPSISLQSRAETKVLLKNQEYESALQKNTAFFDSVLFRLRTFDCDIVQPEKVALLKAALEGMLARAVADREEMVNLLNRTYKLTELTDVLALNMVLRVLQDKVVQWDQDFADIEKAFMPSEKDLRRMTATHLKRLFANQDAFGSLNVAGMTVSEADEKESKTEESANENEKDENADTSTPMAAPCRDLDGAPPDSGEVTPLVGLFEPAPEPTPSDAPVGSRDYDSDSTISALKRDSPRRTRVPSIDISVVHDTDFVSRLPRRAQPTASVADMMKRFSETADASSSNRPWPGRMHNHQLGSESEADSVAPRPKLRRGRTEQTFTRHKEAARLGAMSDNDKSYAANASRIPSVQGRKFDAEPWGSSRPRPSLTAPPTPPRSGRASPNLQPPTTSRASIKGKSPRSGDSVSSGRASPAPMMIKTATRRSFATSNRVTSIARHFDRISREAERERQKRLSAVRGKRARPVSVTKAKVQVFSNLRDAFKDESDTDSSNAGDEEDEGEGSPGSDGESTGGGSPERHSNPSRRSSTRRRSTAGKADIPEMTPVNPSSSLETMDSASSDALPVSASSSMGEGLSEAKSEMSFTERLQIELPTFETSAPLPSVPVTPQMSTDTAEDNKSAISFSQVSDGELTSGGERSSILKTLTGLWAFRAGDYSPLEYPLSAAEHVFADSKVIVRENEPTSIIAFTLSSKTYRDKMRNNIFERGTRKLESFMPEDTGEKSTWDIVSMDDALEGEDTARSDEGSHLKYDFESGSSTIFCRIFFAEKFSQLREACECETSFVESLSRCVQFDASGGKSGSAFLKTKDDRFIAKEISRLEMDALTKFAPAYFDYTRNAINGQRPSALAKIYGFFKIGYRNGVTGRSMRMNVLVMENLFYERRFSKIYDLKGSTRNRLIVPTGRVNEVLLDENLMEIAYKHPLYLREHSKRILRSALFNDTLFLSNLNVMDYSLVVGVDSERHELVVGIVDYIRTFTWDKKLESWVKDSAFLGGGGKGEPTIVTPKQYKNRFRTAMEKSYFPSVPDRWSKLGVEEMANEEDAT